MSADHFGALRRHMLAQVAAQTIYVSARIGKAALAKRVMDAMGNVPRHEFVPVELQAMPTATLRFRSVLTRRSRNRLSWR